MKYMDWVHASIAKQRGESATCPACGLGSVQWLPIGDRETRMGWILLWCDACLKGAHISRAKIPDHIAMTSFDDAEAAIAALPPITMLHLD
jgi:hypothetical protein